jgi:hypothetical protein
VLPFEGIMYKRIKFGVPSPDTGVLAEFRTRVLDICEKVGSSSSSSREAMIHRSASSSGCRPGRVPHPCARHLREGGMMKK